MTGRLLCIALMLLLTACGSVIPRARAPGLHDLGTEAPVIAVRNAPGEVDVFAPTWLESTAMAYRLDYDSPTRRHRYAESRWAAAPGELLQTRLGDVLSVQGHGRGCRLVIDLSEFIQVFDSPSSSTALISGMATLVDGTGHEILDRMRFSIREPSEQADARGGAQAFARASVSLAGRIAGWMDRDGSPAAGRCAS
ncbi:ABC-type transport auxiliary lipoprotein family protein [Methyloversatilis thermotolerans]|uniref:ABC-type transport auxiliary lipoprotein family protein n=1 Tax=Methyloversatilis thermotolerans TaxID=1346290 RepID=UPI00035FC3FD|nr:ABC-type transport auxiliary lipoprotein family protein [Methyloversatilis thermotolerans]